MENHICKFRPGQICKTLGTPSVQAQVLERYSKHVDIAFKYQGISYRATRPIEIDELYPVSFEMVEFKIGRYFSLYFYADLDIGIEE